MNLNSKIGAKGFYTFTAWEAGVLPSILSAGYSYKRAIWLAGLFGAKRKVIAHNNLIVTAGYALLAAIAADEEAGLWGIAIGTDATAPVVGDVSLVAETARSAWTYKASAGAQIERSIILPEASCSVFIKEAGVFGGNNASTTLNSGTLFARYLASYDNSGGGADITIDHILTYQAVP